MPNILYESLTRYFITLSQFGYKKYDSVYKLLFLITADELLVRFKEFVNEEDYKSITESVNYIMGTCYLFPYEYYCNTETCNNFFIGGNTSGSSSPDYLEEIKQLLKNVWVLKPEIGIEIEE